MADYSGSGSGGGGGVTGGSGAKARRRGMSTDEDFFRAFDTIGKAYDDGRISEDRFMSSFGRLSDLYDKKRPRF